MNRKSVRPLTQLHGYWIYRRELAAMETWPLERRRAFVVERLRKVLTSARQGSVFYRERFDSVEFDPDRDFKSAGDLERLPLLSKDDIRAEGERMLDRRHARWSLLANTSGTTGQQMAMHLSERYVAFDYACMYRHWGRAGYRLRSRYAALRSYVPKVEGGPLWKYNFLQNTLYLSAYHLKPANSKDYIEALLRFRPHYLRGYPSSLTVLAEYAWPRRAEFEFVRGVFTASETLLESERATIESVFGKKLFDWYGMTEPAVVITERSDHEGMEVNWEYGYPEFIRDNSLAADERKLVTTSLHNPVMPFIRYETGDIVRLAPETGEDRLYPRVLAIRGRKDECLLAKDGRRMPSLNFYSLLQEFDELLRFQFVQTAYDAVTLKLMLKSGAEGIETILTEVGDAVRRRLGSEFALKLEVTDQFVRSADGKTPTFKRAFAVEKVTPN